MQKIADDSTLLVVRIDRAIKEKLIDLIGRKSMSEVVRELITQYVDKKQIKARRQK